jgi:glutamate 5-kinase
LAVGTTAVQGNFERGDVVTVLDANGQRLANGLVQYSAAEAHRLLGHNSKKFEEILGFSNNDALIHHNDLALL